MEEKRVPWALIVILLLSVAALVFMYSLQYIPAFEIKAIEATGFDEIPYECREMLSSLYGKNRYSFKKGEVEKALEANALVKSAKLSFSAGTLHVLFEREDADSILYDGSGYYLLSDEKPAKLDERDLEAMGKYLPITEISPSYREYLSVYGADEGFAEILSLVYALTDENGTKITAIKYESSPDGGFGQMQLTLGPLFSELFVRERVSKKRISDSIMLIEADLSKDASRSITGKVVRYDLYSDALVRRR